MHKEKIIQLLQIGSIVLFCSKNSFANATNNGECPSNNPTRSICVQLHNAGDIDLVMQPRLPSESGIFSVTSKSYVYYDFGTANGYETVYLIPSSGLDNVTLDASCAQYAWAAQLAEGKKVTINNLS